MAEKPRTMMIKLIWYVSTCLVVVMLARYYYWSSYLTGETFSGKNVVICGGSTGIGEEIAYRFCEEGANVLVVARREWALKNVVANCLRLGAASANYMTADLQKDNTQLLHESQRLFESIDVLVLNHVLYEVKLWQDERNFSDVIKAFGVNVLSYIELTSLFLPSLQRSRGRLLVISSGLGVFTYPYFALYCSNKHALHGFYNALRQDLALENSEMSITLSVLGAISTENAINASRGNPIAGDGGWKRLSTVDAARSAVQATLVRKRQVYYPKLLMLHEFASSYFPAFTEWLIRFTYGLQV